MRMICVFLCVVASLISISTGQTAPAWRDAWELVIQNGGVSAMHAALLPSNRVVYFDRNDYGKSAIVFPGGFCVKNPLNTRLPIDCTAHSVTIDINTNAIKTLKVTGNPFCSSAAHRADGSLYQTGGWNVGAKATQVLGPGSDDDWVEDLSDPLKVLLAPRWYSTNQILPDNRVIVIGGRRQMNYEFQPRSPGETKFDLPFLYQTTTPGSEHNLYPFVWLHVDGNLIIFANQDTIILNYKTNSVVKTFPRIPDGPRNYPATGGAALLPIVGRGGYKNMEIMVCGGAPADAYPNIGKGIFVNALQSCGRMVITSAKPKWTMENMPTPRVMSDMLVLPTGEILIINGAKNGTAGWRSAKDPIYTPVTYEPSRRRFTTWQPSTIPRMYHSVALVLPDGKIFVAGSNANPGYEFRNVEFPTELRIEKYSPWYLNSMYNYLRPKIVEAPAVVQYGSLFQVLIDVKRAEAVKYHLYAPPFTTHTVAMNQRMLALDFRPVEKTATSRLFVGKVFAPPNANIAPAGYYLFTVLNKGIPSKSTWMRIAAEPVDPVPGA